MNGNLNILMLGGAKRVSMARMFIGACAAEGLEPKLFSYELDSRVPVSVVAEVVIGMRWSDPAVMEHLGEVVDRHKIDVVVPFVDGAVAVASRLGAAMPQLFVPSCDEAVAAAMFDKIEADRIFHDLCIPTPDVVNRHDKVIAKPRFGSASKGLVVAGSADELPEGVNREDYLIQRYVENREEITVDCYVSREGKPLVVSPRVRLEVVGGEVTRTRTIACPEIVEMTVSLLERCDMKGAVTVQFIRDLDSGGKAMIMEVNPRLGGGAVCTVHAGGNIPWLIVKEAIGDPVEPFAVKPGVEIARYMQEVIVSR